MTYPISFTVYINMLRIGPIYYGCDEYPTGPVSIVTHRIDIVIRESQERGPQDLAETTECWGKMLLNMKEVKSPSDDPLSIGAVQMNACETTDQVLRLSFQSICLQHTGFVDQDWGK
jgi:hypothetical protein